eukprot:CAMPEP_0185588352 /NCGR_PEP_ID=MMETSP0434-20130131/52698_1 /TAXON_ID=626734 ORGANISM="Favella taraikaensis, Strain Fe Narragansett Bay" /NCGR_SAMPLE_ID=MMETSP0434 /ASSEMBLY_ACC=CAM_ASM_000379 /LENGTH=43 /DNA_ID= /DNA_START= /DNA_END= /DNA_ORIENTATION=
MARKPPRLLNVRKDSTQNEQRFKKANPKPSDNLDENEVYPLVS